METRIRLIRRLAGLLLLGLSSLAWAGLSDDPAAAAFQAHRRDVTLFVEGHVKRTLADDRSGSRHQRFILQTSSGLTLLVAHNLDLAPRLAGLRPGDFLRIRGEYVWNPEGGLLHWTHRDPSGRHSPGYIEWNGRRYD